MRYFKSLNGIKSYFLKNGSIDFFKFKGLIYTQEQYDLEGKQIDFKNKETTNQISIYTTNRYIYGFKNCDVEFIENIGFYRNDISYKGVE
jgi:hypothetical protein